MSKSNKSAANDAQIDDIDWEGLYASNPDLYEQKRKEEITKIISSAPAEYQLKLLQLQWKIDAIHATQPPLKATIEVSKLMWDSFYELNDKLGEFVEITKQDDTPQRPTLKVVK